MKPNVSSIAWDTNRLAVASASSELAAVIYDLLSEAMAQGTDLPPEFRVWMAAMTAQRSRSLLEKLCWRAFQVGVDKSVYESEPGEDRITLLPPKQSP